MSLLLWLLCLMALAVAILFVPHPALIAVTVLFVAAPVVSWLILVLLRKKVRIRLTAPGVVGKRKTFSLGAKLESDTALPFGKTVMWLQLTNAVTGEKQRKRVSFRGSGEWILESAYCGCIECRAANAWCYDIFGILPVRIPCKAKKRIVVMPDTFPVELETVLTRSNQEDCTEYAPDKKGADRTETLQIRDYTPGDPLQQIHWKLSSKLDRLIVRDPAQPVDRELMVFLEQSDETRTPEQADALMESVVSVCQALTEAGQPFRLAWNEDIFVSYDVSNKDQLPEAVSAILKARRVKTCVSGSSLFQKTKGNADVGAVLYFCSALHDDPFPGARTKVFLCGEGTGENVTAFSLESMVDTLRNLTWS
ncbi:MAG: DUF58 domain-containing protein [Oscillospiraceae bacterium]|nr:DUF58 domain-containing protein [Oscillospiraceae bacterium]